MLVRIHGFDWETYNKQVMPSFSRWLIERDDSQVAQLYEQTRCARDEEFLPPSIHALRTWSRAQAFVQQLPQGAHAAREYRLLCTAETFTEFSDRYIHHHPPQLYHNADALRAVWGAIVEEYCQAWLIPPCEHSGTGSDGYIVQTSSGGEQRMNRGEMVSLLRSAGLDELAGEISTQVPLRISLEEELDDDEESDETPLPLQGVEIGHQPETLHLRGWLGTHSIRALAIFELLACSRRSMPFGYHAGEPYESYIGYLTPDEAWQLAQCIKHITAPDIEKAQADVLSYRRQHMTGGDTARMIDEVLPAYADAFLKVVRMASQYGLGLLCSI
ncbi:hypothetical protein ccbrp13_27700 [Ktedonobacteria bacterium brp13]|nr:hypothetical protein ccbrp13_27700 [Ktedonobacteria bacterium brp13]